MYRPSKVAVLCSLKVIGRGNTRKTFGEAKSDRALKEIWPSRCMDKLLMMANPLRKYSDSHLFFFQTLSEDTITGPFYFLLCRTFMEFIVFLFLTLNTNVLFFFNLNQLTSKASNSFFATLSEITLTDCVGCIFQYLFLFFLQYPVINIIRRSRTDCVYFLLL